MWRYYVDDMPTSDDIESLADVFIGSGMRVEPLLRAIVTHPTFWAPETRWAEEVIEEFAAFPSGEHDDLVDSSTQALIRFRQGGLASDRTTLHK